MKIVINRCFGGFSLSDEAIKMLGFEPDPGFHDFNNQYYAHEKRTDLKLIECIEKLGTERASGKHAQLKIIEIPDDVEWGIQDYDGQESVHEKHRVWY